MFLRCSNEDCGRKLDLHNRVLACPDCGDLLELAVEGIAKDPADLKKLWLQRRMSQEPRYTSGVWRFREFLPDCYDEVITLSEGNTPLVRGQKTADYAGMRNIRFKHLGWNPTACFKDLGMTTGITEAKFVGAKIVGCASTGNTSASMAAYAARAGLRARVYLPEGKISVNKLAQALDFGAEVVQIKGSFDLALDTLLNTNDPDLYFLNSINAFRIEGQKTVMFEMLEQLEWQVPDYVVVPGGNLGNSAAFGKGLLELKSFGFIDKLPRIVVVQAEGANPFSRMWKSGTRELSPTEHPETEATAIRIGNPRSWKKSLKGVEQSGGFIMDVNDEEIADAKSMIGRDGIGCEPASATTLAALRKLRANNQIDRDAVVVAILTGHALKDTEFIIRHHDQQSAAMAEVHS